METTGHLLLKFDHAQVTPGLIVVNESRQISREPQHFLTPVAQVSEEIVFGVSFDPASFPCGSEP
jgi:hypothetical protein